MDLANRNGTSYLHRNIRCLRKKLKLSQEELGCKIGLNRGNIASYENGSAEPKICNLLKLSNLFGVSIIDLTQKDLSEERNFSQANNTFEKISKGDKELLEQFYHRIDELEQVIESVHTCQQFCAKKLGDLPPEVQRFQHNFDQLYDASQSLLRNHHNLIDFIKCRLK